MQYKGWIRKYISITQFPNPLMYLSLESISFHTSAFFNILLCFLTWSQRTSDPLLLFLLLFLQLPFLFFFSFIVSNYEIWSASVSPNQSSQVFILIILCIYIHPTLQEQVLISQQLTGIKNWSRAMIMLSLQKKKISFITDHTLNQMLIQLCFNSGTDVILLCSHRLKFGFKNSYLVEPFIHQVLIMCGKSQRKIW